MEQAYALATLALAHATGLAFFSVAGSVLVMCLAAVCVFDRHCGCNCLGLDYRACLRGNRVVAGLCNCQCWPNSADLVYFAFANYTTPGYGDVIPVESWRLLGPMTAMNGVLLLGWSTDVIFEVLWRAMKRSDMLS